MNAVNGRLEAAESDLARALAIGRSMGDANLQALVLHLLALQRGWQGRYRESLVLGDEGMRLAREHRLAIPLLRCLWNQGLDCTRWGTTIAPLAALAEGLALAEKLGDDAFIPRYLNTVGFVRIDCGDFERGIALSEHSYEVTNRSSRAGHGTGAERRAFIRNNEADAFMAQGDLAAAAQALDESLHIVQHPPPSRWMTWRYKHALPREPWPARPAARRRRRRAAPCRAEPGDGDGGPLAEVRELGLAARGRERHRAPGVGRSRGRLRRALAIALGIEQPRQIWLSHAAGRLHEACGRKTMRGRPIGAAWHIIKGLRERTQDPGLRAGSSPRRWPARSWSGCGAEPARSLSGGRRGARAVAA